MWPKGEIAFAAQKTIKKQSVETQYNIMNLVTKISNLFTLTLIVIGISIAFPNEANSAAPCNPGACYDVTTSSLTGVTVVILKSDGACSDSKIISRVTNYFNSFSGKHKTQACSNCACTGQQNVPPGNNNDTFTVTTYVGAFSTCLVTVQVTISYTGGSGYTGACTPPQG